MSGSTALDVILEPRVGAGTAPGRRRIAIGSDALITVAVRDSRTGALVPGATGVSGLYWLPGTVDDLSAAQPLGLVEVSPGQLQAKVKGIIPGTFLVWVSIEGPARKTAQIAFDVSSNGQIVRSSTGTLPWNDILAAAAAAGVDAAAPEARRVAVDAGAAAGAEAAPAAALEAIAPQVAQVDSDAMAAEMARRDAQDKADIATGAASTATSAAGTATGAATTATGAAGMATNKAKEAADAAAMATGAATNIDSRVPKAGGVDITNPIGVAAPTEEKHAAPASWVRRRIKQFASLDEAMAEVAPDLLRLTSVAYSDGAAVCPAVWRRDEDNSLYPTLARRIDARGKTWCIDVRGIDPRMLGAKVDGVTNDVDELRAAWQVVLATCDPRVGSQYPGRKQATLLAPEGTLLARPWDNLATGQVILATTGGVGTGASIRGYGPGSVLDGPAISVGANGQRLSNFWLIDSRPAVKATKYTFGVRCDGGRGLRMRGLTIRDRWVGYDAKDGATNKLIDSEVSRNIINAWMRGAGDTEIQNCDFMLGDYGLLGAASGEVKTDNSRARDNTYGNVYFDGQEPHANVENYLGMITSTSSLVKREMAAPVVEGNVGRARFVTSPLLQIAGMSALANPHIFFGSEIPVGTDSMVRLRLSGAGDLSEVLVAGVNLLAAPVPWAGSVSAMEAAVAASINARKLVVDGEPVTAKTVNWLYVSGPTAWVGKTLSLTATGTLGLTDPRKATVITTVTDHGYKVGDDIYLNCGVGRRGVERVIAVVDTKRFITRIRYPGSLTGTVCKPHFLRKKMSVTVSGAADPSYNGVWTVLRCAPHYLELCDSNGVPLPYAANDAAKVTVPGWDTFYNCHGPGVNDTFQGGGNDNYTRKRGGHNHVAVGSRFKSNLQIDQRFDREDAASRMTMVGTSGRGRQQGAYSDIYPGGTTFGFGGFTSFSTSGDVIDSRFDHWSIFSPYEAGEVVDGEAEAWNRVGASGIGVRLEIAGIEYTLGVNGGPLYQHELVSRPGDTLGVKLSSGAGGGQATIGTDANGGADGDLALTAGRRLVHQVPLRLDRAAVIIAASDQEAIEAGVPRLGQYFTPEGAARIRMQLNALLAPSLSGDAIRVAFDRNLNASSAAVQAAALTGEHYRKMTASSFAADLVFARASTALYTSNGGVVTAAPADTIRMDRSGAALDALGWLLEPESTNQVPNPRGEGAVAGAPGTGPTGWVLGIGTGGTDGLQRSITLVTEDGIPAIDIRLWGTTTAARSDRYLVQFASNTAAAAAEGQDWTGQVQARLAPGAAATMPAGLLRNRLAARDSTGTGVVSLTETALALLNDRLRDQRVAVTATMPASTAYASHGIGLNYASGVAIDVTVRVGMPHLARGSLPCTPALPPAGTQATATRAVDLLRLSDSAFAGLSPTRGTAIVEFMVPATGLRTPDRPILQLDDGTNANRLGLRMLAGTMSVAGITSTGGVDTLTGTAGDAAAGVRHRAGLRWTAAGLTVCLDGGPMTPLVGALPTGLNRLRLGGNADGSKALGGYLRAYAIWGYALSDADMQAACVPGADWPG